MPSKLTLTILVILNFLAAGCSVKVRNDFPTQTPQLIISATLPPSTTPHPSETPLPPPPTATVAPVSGTTSTQLNVRSEPSTASEVLGIIAANISVQIVGQDPSGNWWQIVYEGGINEKGWITAQYVETAAKPEVPVIGGGGVNPNSGGSAVVIQQLNIRSGPGTGFESLGILNTNDVVSLTGKNRDSIWLQIEFAGGPDGRGWINSAFVRADGLDSLPIVSDLGEMVGTGTPVSTPLPPTPTVVPAPMDFDSADAPLKTIFFDRTGTSTLIYNGDVSIPEGDTDDWIAFTSYDNLVLVSIECIGNGSLHAEITGSESAFTCNELEKAITVPVGIMQLIHIEAVPASTALQYVNYVLTIKVSQ